jgi:8-oxo-dGTP pyrophosphatase MutT (NUDIX family)
MTEPVAVRDAATVMLVRDGDHGLEVLMVRRHLRAAFVAGAYVFPGGAVDDADRHTDLEAVCEGRSDGEASAVLGLDAPSGGLAYWVAAVRECFEEAGVLLAYDRAGRIVDFRDPEVEARFVAHRRAVDRGQRRLVDVCAEEGLRLAVDGMHYFSHWITPVGAPRRFDTRFFVSLAPEGQVPLHDARETIAQVWVRPADALAHHRAGHWELILPTQRSLEALARFDDAALLLATVANGRRPCPT